jgi:ABC-type branched-subunit amino acid transport system substrate-binding protein
LEGLIVNRIFTRIFAAALFATALATSAFAAAPIKIGFSMALTGGGGANGKVALIAMKIWQADVNAKGGLHTNELHTVLGNFHYGPDGEWQEARFLTVQYRNITGKTLDQFNDPAKVAVVDPPQYKTGALIYAYAKAVQ